MAETLMDQITKRMTEQDQRISLGPDVKSLTAAKTGKAGGGTGAPGQSTLGQQAVAAQTQTSQAQQRLAGQQAAVSLEEAQAAQDQQAAQQQAALQAERDAHGKQLRNQEIRARESIGARERESGIKLNAKERSQVNQINHAFRQQLEQLAADRSISVDNIFSDLRRSEKQLELRRDQAQLEQRGFLLALQDQQYMAELDRIGKARMLQDQFEYEEDAMRIRLGNDMVDFLDQQNWRELYFGNQRDFETRMQQLKIEEAEEIFTASAKAAAKRQMWQSGASIVTSIVRGAAKSSTGEDKGTDVTVEKAETESRNSTGAGHTYGGKQGTSGEEGPVY